MQQNYHKNAKTNIHYRQLIHNSTDNNKVLAHRHQVSEKTVHKWKIRTQFIDKSSRPKQVKYALSEEEQALVCTIRKLHWLPIDEVTEAVFADQATKKRSAIYRTWVRQGINKKPQEERDKAQKFKEYEPGFLHIDVTYLPKIAKQRCYLFVAIDRATRMLYYEFYDNKTAENTVGFMEKCRNFFPFNITHVLTDNGLEFTNSRLVSKKGVDCKKESRLDELCKKSNITHRCTKPNTPQTNGMVERVNRTIKDGTIKQEVFSTKASLKIALLQFLLFYNTYRRHSGLRTELQVKTPFEAIKKWHQIKPELFKETPQEFMEKIVNLKQEIATVREQPCET